MATTKSVRDQGNPIFSQPKLDLPRGRKNGDGPHDSPWLVVRYQAGDTGNRPLASGTVFWESPDVWTQGSLGINQPVVNESTEVFARVTNLGLQDASPVTIKFYWADPSVAIVEDPTKLIGEITGALIPANNSLVFQSPTNWTPTEVNNGHECLVVEAFVQVYDPLISPMDPVDDRHVGQKNEQLLTLQKGQSFKFQLSAHNITAADRDVVIEVRPGLIPRNFTQRFGIPAHWQAELVDPLLPLPVSIDIDAKPVRTARHSERAARRLAGPERKADIAHFGGAQAAQSQHFRAGEVRRVTITGALPPSARLGEVYVIRIVQRIGTVVTGGYTLYITLGNGKPR